MNVIGFSGKKGVGKDYIAKHFFKRDKDGIMIVSLADQIKILTLLGQDFTYDELYVKKSQQSRESLIELGQKYRNLYDSNVWCRILEMWMRVHHNKNNIHTFLVTDVRMPHEVEWIRSLGGYIIRIESPIRNRLLIQSEGGSSHNNITETALDDYYFTYNLHNDEGYDIEEQLILQEIDWTIPKKQRRIQRNKVIAKKVLETQKIISSETLLKRIEHKLNLYDLQFERNNMESNYKTITKYFLDNNPYNSTIYIE